MKVYEYDGIVTFCFGAVSIQVNMVSTSYKNLEDVEAIERLLIRDSRAVLEESYGIDFEKHLVGKRVLFFLLMSFILRG